MQNIKPCPVLHLFHVKKSVHSKKGTIIPRALLIQFVVGSATLPWPVNYKFLWGLLTSISEKIVIVIMRGKHRIIIPLTLFRRVRANVNLWCTSLGHFPFNRNLIPPSLSERNGQCRVRCNFVLLIKRDPINVWAIKECNRRYCQTIKELHWAHLSSRKLFCSTEDSQ